jgi:hypothetical protein
MPDPEEQLQMLRNEEKAARDEQVAEELTQDDRLAATLSQHRSEVPSSAEGSTPVTPDTA